MKQSGVKDNVQIQEMIGSDHLLAAGEEETRVQITDDIQTSS